MLDQQFSHEQELFSAIPKGVDAVKKVLEKEGVGVSKNALFAAKDFPEILRALVTHDATHALSLFFSKDEQRPFEDLGFSSTKYLDMLHAVKLGLRENSSPEVTELEAFIENNLRLRL